VAAHNALRRPERDEAQQSTILALAQLAEQMGNIIALGPDMSEAEQDRYDAFAAVYEERKATERVTRERFERREIADQMRAVFGEYKEKIVI
jgi:hypothetical protein